MGIGYSLDCQSLPVIEKKVIVMNSIKKIIIIMITIINEYLYGG